MEAGAFNVGLRSGADGPVIVLEGELDLGSAKAFQDCVRSVLADHSGASRSTWRRSRSWIRPVSELSSPRYKPLLRRVEE
jgi:hypothetical protein